MPAPLPVPLPVSLSGPLAASSAAAGPLPGPPASLPWPLRQRSLSAARGSCLGAPMTPRAAECGLCRFGFVFKRCNTVDELLDPDSGVVHFQCTKGHRPRFYLFAYTNGKRNPGWRRRCDDFEPNEGE